MASPAQTSRASTAFVERFARTLVYRTVSPVPAILSDIEQIADLDGVSERKQNQANRRGIAALLIGLVGGIWALSTESVWGGLFFGSALVLGVIALLIARKHRKTNVENFRYELVRGLLALLRCDIRPSAMVHLELDLRPPEDRSKLVNSESAGACSIKHYEDRWLRMRARLMDHTDLSLEIAEILQHRTIKKHSASGKTKVKSKCKSTQSVSLELRVRPEKYPGLAKLGGTGQRLLGRRALHGMILKKFEAGADSLRLELTEKCVGRPKGRSSTHDLPAQMLLALYRILNFSKASRKHPTTA